MAKRRVPASTGRIASIHVLRSKPNSRTGPVIRKADILTAVGLDGRDGFVIQWEPVIKKADIPTAVGSSIHPKITYRT
jgi:hypothetical protein